MEIKKAEIIAKRYELIKELQNEKIQLEKIALNLSKTELNCSIKISTERYKEDEKENVLDSDGSIKKKFLDGHDKEKGTSFSLFASFHNPFDYKVENNKSSDMISTELEIDDITSFEIIGVLIMRKQAKIDNLLKSIESC